MHQPVWKNRSLATPLSLADNEVHIWKLFLDASPGPALELLSAGEQQHYRNLRHPRAAVRYLNTRALSRRILGAYLQQPPASLTIEIAEGGKPHLRNDPLQYNLSHSQGLGLLAVSARQALGVDLEQLRPVKYLPRIAARLFPDDDPEQPDGQNQIDSQQRFFTRWTAMEARQKALGRGIFQTRVQPEQADCVHFIPEPGFIAAIATTRESPPPALKFLKPR